MPHPPGTITLGELRALLPTPLFVSPGIQELRYFLCAGGKTGRKIHAARVGSLWLECGHFLGLFATTFEVMGADHFDVPYSQVCAKCFGTADEVAERVGR